MNSLRMMEANLPPGFRFHPRDEELISGYLAGKVSGDRGGFPAMMIHVDLNKCEPWALPGTACVGGKEWYFYSLPGRKYASGQRTKRTTLSGYWKATGKDRPVVDPRRGGVVVGMRKTLVFYHGRSPKGRKTSWVMHEFRLEASAANSVSSSKDEWVLCRVFHRGREPPFEASVEKSHDDAGPSSLMFPPMHSTFSLEQVHLSHEGCQQTPCSSSHPPGQQTQWRGSSAATHVLPTEGNMPEMIPNSFAHPLGMPGWGSYLNSSS